MKSSMVAHWQSEKEAIGTIRALKEELDHHRGELERESDLERAAEIRYGVIPELERKVEDATKRLAESVLARAGPDDEDLHEPRA